MEWLKSLIDWASANSTLLWWLCAVSLALFLLTPFIVGWIVLQLPTDYVLHTRRRPLESLEKLPWLRFLLLIAKNLLGIALVVAGLVMLFTPGQGLLTIVVGITLIDFPGKFRLERWFITRENVWRSINWLRKRAGRPEIERPTN